MNDAPDLRRDGPVSEPERVVSMDVLRGVAVLGIFVMNSRNLALPLRAFDNPAFPDGNARPIDVWVWALENLIFEDKMIAIFSMLFGAGIAAAAQRAPRPAWTHARRMFWLLVIGLLHAFGLWYGDILNTYALCGWALYPFRRAPAGVLLGLGVALLTVAVWARVGPTIADSVWSDAPAGAAERVESRSDRIWRESLAGEKAAYEGSWLELAAWRARLNEVWHWHGVYGFNFWRCGGFVLIGIGLLKLRVLDASRPGTVYWGMVLGGYAAGLALASVGAWPQLSRVLRGPLEAGTTARQIVGQSGWTLRYMGSAAIAIGHVGAVMLVCRACPGWLLLKPFAAAGRMALSNYLMQTVIGVVIFDGWALGHWGKWRMSEIAAMVLAVWIVQLALSPWWLSVARYGPAEWLWRSLTYWKLQPLRRSKATEQTLAADM